MGLTDKHLAYGDDIPQTQIEKDYYWKSKHLEEENGKPEQKQQACEDVISREDTMTALRAEISFICTCDKLNAIRIIEGMPPITQKQQACEDRNCISRQAVLEILKKNRYRFNISQEGCWAGEVLWSKNLIKDDACKEIEQLPPVIPIPKEKTGKWIQQPRCEGDEQPDLVCPDCGFKISWWDTGNFCAKCGKRLEGGAE